MYLRRKSGSELSLGTIIFVLYFYSTYYSKGLLHDGRSVSLIL